MYTKHIRSPLHTQHTEKNVKLIQIFNYPPLTLTHQGDHKKQKQKKTGSNIFPSPLPPPALAFTSDDVDFGNKLSDCDVVTIFLGGGGAGGAFDYNHLQKVDICRYFEPHFFRKKSKTSLWRIFSFYEIFQIKKGYKKLKNCNS